MGTARQAMSRGQFIQYWLHVDAEIAEGELAAFGCACGAQLFLVLLLAVLVIDHGPYKQQETPGEERHGSRVAPPATLDQPSTSQADPAKIRAM